MMENELANGFAAQNQLYDSVAMLMGGKRAARDVSALKTPTYQADLSAIQRQLMTAVKEIKKEAGSGIEQAQKLQKDIFAKIVSGLTKGQSVPECRITVEDVAEQVANAVPGIDEHMQEQVKKLFIQMAGGDVDENA